MRVPLKRSECFPKGVYGVGRAYFSLLVFGSEGQSDRRGSFHFSALWIKATPPEWLHTPKREPKALRTLCIHQKTAPRAYAPVWRSKLSESAAGEMLTRSVSGHRCGWSSTQPRSARWWLVVRARVEPRRPGLKARTKMSRQQTAGRFRFRFSRQCGFLGLFHTR